MPPEQSASATGNGNTIVQIVGDGNSVVLGHPHLYLTRFEAHRHLATPLNALSPYSRSTHLQGREDELASLCAFLANPKPISVRVLVGGGGSGKTRLALDLCDHMQAEGWNTGFATGTEMERFFAGHNLSAWGWQKPTLVVVDYAAAKAQALGRWLDELADRTAPTPLPLRILLLERYVDKDTGWWSTVFGGDGRAMGKLAMLDPADPVSIRPLSIQQDRLALLHNMLAIASPAKTIPLPLDDLSFNQQLMRLGWAGDPLYLMMAAVAMAHFGKAQVFTLARTDLAAHVAKLEANRLKKMAKEHALPGALVLHLTACATLAQGIAEADLIPFIRDEQTALGWTSAPAALAELLRQALPQPHGIAPITPDVIGEAFVLHALRGNTGQTTVQRCHARVGHRVAETVIRCVQDFAETSTAPLGWLRTIVLDIQHDASALAALYASMPMESLALREVNLDVAQRMLFLLATNGTTAPAQRAVALSNLAIAQSQMGHHEPALKAAQEAADLYRSLADQRPDVFLPGLAMSLNNLANGQSDLGQRAPAMETAQEAADLYRSLADQRPDVFLPDWAMSLNNLANKQSDLGQLAPALKTAQEAADLYRSLADQRPDVFLPDLAMSLNNLAAMQSDLGQDAPALKTAQEAVGFLRSLAAQRPDVFLPDLAPSLNNLANRQSALGQHAPALEAAQEAVGYRRRLATQRPEVFLPGLARSMIVLALCTYEVQGAESALTLAHEAVKTLHPAFMQRPQAHGSLMLAMRDEYLKLCQSANQAPDNELIAPLTPYLPLPQPE
nr:tetratricopeptide repeat protein [uncultured Albidiferax sp.]